MQLTGNHDIICSFYLLQPLRRHVSLSLRSFHRLELAGHGECGIGLGPDLIDLDARGHFRESQGTGLAVDLENALHQLSAAIHAAAGT